MKPLVTLAAVALGVVALGAASRRLANHQAVLPEVSSRINTRVIRINQDRQTPAPRPEGSAPPQKRDALP